MGGQIITIGLVEKVLIVTYTVRNAIDKETVSTVEDQIITRIISARPALKKERERYINWFKGQIG